MKVMLVIDGKVVTAPLDAGTILPGITRDSLIQLLQAEGTTVEERPMAVDELGGAQEQGILEEAFGCETAAVITPLERSCTEIDYFSVRNTRQKDP